MLLPQMLGELISASIGRGAYTAFIGLCITLAFFQSRSSFFVFCKSIVLIWKNMQTKTKITCMWWKCILCVCVCVCVCVLIYLLRLCCIQMSDPRRSLLPFFPPSAGTHLLVLKNITTYVQNEILMVHSVETKSVFSRKKVKMIEIIYFSLLL